MVNRTGISVVGRVGVIAVQDVVTQGIFVLVG